MVSHDESLRCDTDRMDALASTLRLTGDQARALAGRVTEAQLLAALPGAGVARLHTVAETALQSAAVVTARARLAAGFTIEPRVAIRLDDLLAAGEIDDAVAVPLDDLAHQHVAEAVARLRAAGGGGKGRPTGGDIRPTLEALTPSELDATFGALTDDELRAVFHRLHEGGKQGLSRSDRMALFAHIGERVARATWRRLGSFETEIEPSLAAVVGRLPTKDEHGRSAVWQVSDLQGPLAVGGPGDPSAFDADDFHQGYLGDCYLQAGLQSLAAQRPELLAAMLRRNPNGTVTVQLADGERAVVDPSFVTESYWSRTPGFVEPTDESDAGADHEIWAQVIEKAWAILRGGYRKIWSGNPGDALVALVGGTTSERDPGDHDPDDLARRLAAGEILTVLTSSERRDARLRAHHAYRLVDVDPVREVVTLENPWVPGGSAPFTLPWDDLVRAASSIDANRLPTSGDERDRR